MAFKLPKDRTLEHSATSGSGPWTLTGAVDSSYQPFSAWMSDGDTTLGGVAEPGVASAWGVLTFHSSGPTMTLTTSDGSVASFGSGTKEIFAGYPGTRTLSVDGANSFTSAQQRQAQVNLGAIPGGPYTAMVNGTVVVAALVGGAITFAVKTLAGADPSAADPVDFYFRDATAATGDYVKRSVTAALSVTIASTKTLGASNGVPFKVWLTAVDTGSGVELGVVNCWTGTQIFPLGESQLVSPTATPGNSAGVIYTTSGQTSKPFRKIAVAEFGSGLTTAGTWDAFPTKIQPYGPGIHSPGEQVQLAASQTGAVATGSTTVPLDDTIPQNTEGDQYLSQAITPQSAANVLAISVGAVVSGPAGNFIMSLFQDSTASALATVVHHDADAAVPYTLPMEFWTLAGTASSTTLKVRIGNNAAGTNTFNGTAGARKFGGALASYLAIKELAT